MQVRVGTQIIYLPLPVYHLLKPCQDTIISLGDEKSNLLKIRQFRKIEGVPATVVNLNKVLSLASLVVSSLEDINGQVRGFLRAQ